MVRTERWHALNPVERLSDLFVRRAVPKYIRSDNRPEFTVKKVREGLASLALGAASGSIV